MPAPATSIELPGRGRVYFEELKVDKAVQEYDENLRFGRNNDTGQWCIFLIKRGELPLPVIGFNEIPHPEDALKRLYHADALRRGNEILDEVVRSRQEVEDKREMSALEADAILAEHAEWALRTQGKTRHTSIHMNGTHKKMGGWS